MLHSCEEGRISATPSNEAWMLVTAGRLGDACSLNSCEGTASDATSSAPVVGSNINDAGRPLYWGSFKDVTRLPSLKLN
jgi:hypothetical protein